MAKLYARPRGTQDVLPSDSWKWHYVEGAAQQVAAKYGYKEIRVPTFESTEVFSRGVGDTTDIVSKEMYTFEDKGGRSLTLRPEGTAAVVRAVLENGLLASSPLPLKSYYIQSCFRYEKAQKGRLREFHQFGIECFGTNEPAADAEVIMLADDLLCELLIGRSKQLKLMLEINSIGCKACRAVYNKALRAYFETKRSQLCETCLTRLEKNPMRILDCKAEPCQQITLNAPVMLDYLDDECKTHFEEVKHLLDEANIVYRINPMIVRGLDYYTNTVFEFVAEGVGTQGTVCAGGRYNGLINEFGGLPTPAAGFGMGLERVLMAMEEINALPAPPQGPVVFASSIGTAGRTAARNLVQTLRAEGLYAEYDISNRSVKAQMKLANRLNAQVSLVLGDNETESGTAKAKRMQDGNETDFDLKNPLNSLQAALQAPPKSK